MNHFFGESIPLIYRFIKNKSINPLGLLQIGALQQQEACLNGYGRAL